MNLIETVLKLDAGWKAAVRAYEVSGSAGDHLMADLALEDLKDIGPTAAPKLARALKDVSSALPDTSAMRSCVVDFEQSHAADDDAKYWRDMAKDLAGSVGEVEDAINGVRMILAEIEKELA